MKTVEQPILEQPRSLAAWQAHLPALAGYLLISLLMLAPLLPRFGSAILGGPVAVVDGWQNVWNLWWTRQALAAGANPFHTPLLYYPDGADLYLQTLNLSNGALLWPVTALFGQIAAYNTALLLALVLSGLGGYALALHITGRRLLSFVGGLLFAFSPFHMTKVWDGQLELIALQWLAFYALFLLRAVEGARRRDALLAGVFLALIGYTSWYYLLFFAVYSAFFGLLWLATTPGWPRRRMIAGQLALAALAGGLLLAPLLAPSLARIDTGSGTYDPSDPLDVLLIHSADLFDFFLPSYLHPLWGRQIAEAGSLRHPYIAGWNVALGYGALALALLGSIVARRVAWRWSLLAAAALVLSLGPLLHVGGRLTSLKLPYALLLYLPGVGVGQRPSHFMVITTLLFAPLAALGLGWLLDRTAAARRPLLMLLVVGLLAFELAPPRWSIFTLETHPYYASLRGQPGALLDLPPPYQSSERLQFQMAHGMPILAGYVSRTPVYHFPDNCGVRQLWRMQPEETPMLCTLPEDGLLVLNAYGIQNIVINWSFMNARERAGLEAALAQLLPGVVPVHQDATLSAYRVPPVQVRPFASFGAGWYPEEHDGPRHWRWMAGESTLELVNPTGAPSPITLQLRATSFAQPRAVELLLNDQPIQPWPVATREAQITLRLLLPPGRHTLTLHAPASHNPADGRDLSIALVGAELRWGRARAGPPALNTR